MKRAIGRFATYRRSCFNVFSTFPFRRKARRGFRSRLDPPKQRRNIFRSTSPLHSGPASDLVRDKKSKSFIFSKNRYGGILQRLIPEFDNSRHFVRRSGFSQSATVKIFIPRRTNRSMLDHLLHPSILLNLSSSSNRIRSCESRNIPRYRSFKNYLSDFESKIFSHFEKIEATNFSIFNWLNEIRIS